MPQQDAAYESGYRHIDIVKHCLFGLWRQMLWSAWLRRLHLSLVRIVPMPAVGSPEHISICDVMYI